MLESFFENRERLNDETAEDSKTANKKKAAFKRKYQKNKKLKKKFNPTPHKKKENTKGRTLEGYDFHFQGACILCRETA